MRMAAIGLDALVDAALRNGTPYYYMVPLNLDNETWLLL